MQPQTGPLPRDESFEDLAARTGLSEADFLSKKMSFRKNMKPEKKLEEMVPMVKELRQAAKERMQAQSPAARMAPLIAL
jgi:hypothetical protein